MTRRMASTRAINTNVLAQLGHRAGALVSNELSSLLKQLSRHEEASHGSVVWSTLLITARANPLGTVDFQLEADVAARGEVVREAIGESLGARLDRLEREHRDLELQMEQAARSVAELTRRNREVLPHLQRSALLGVASPETARRAVAVLNGESHQWSDPVEEPAGEKNPRA